MKKIISVSALALFVGALMFISSCSKHDDGHYGNAVEQSDLQKIKALIQKLPLTKKMGEEADAHRIGSQGMDNILSGAWTFSNPDGGTHWSSTSGVHFTNHGNTVYLSPSAFGVNSASVGTVVAGSSALDINGTFCFSGAASGSNLDLFNLGYYGVSGVVGISGDLKGFASADHHSNFFELFHGLAYYVVYDDQAEGVYDVVNWLDVNLGDNTGLRGSCFAFVFDFRNGKLYMSRSGTITVTGGEMNFEGEYFEIAGFILGDSGINTDNITYNVVSGFGTMGCE